MAVWGALLSIAGQGLAQGLSAANNRAARAAEENEYARREGYYRGKANEDPMADSRNRQAIGVYDREAQRQIENARNVSKITGATPEYSLAVQQGLAEGRADLMGNISATASERADKYDVKAELARQGAADAEQAYHAQRNEQFANLAGNAASTFGSMVDSASTSSAPQRKTANSQNEEKKATGTAVATHSSDQYNAAAQRTSNPYEKNALKQTAAAAKQQEQLANSAAATPNSTAYDPEPDRSDFFAHAQWAARHSNPYRI